MAAKTKAKARGIILNERAWKKIAPLLRKYQGIGPRDRSLYILTVDYARQTSNGDIIRRRAAR